MDDQATFTSHVVSSLMPMTVFSLDFHSFGLHIALATLWSTPPLRARTVTLLSLTISATAFYHRWSYFRMCSILREAPTDMGHGQLTLHTQVFSVAQQFF